MKRLLLLGGGHAQLAVLEALARRPRAGLEVTLVTPNRHSLYSGMLPGWMAGHYRLDACRIDLRPLAAAAGVRLLRGRACGLDAGRQRVSLEDGSHLLYDLLSLDVGSETDVSRLTHCGQRLLPVRPLEALVTAWPALLAAAGRPGYRLLVIGAGAAGVELAFAVRQAFRQHHCPASVELISGAEGLLPGHGTAVVRRTQRLLAARGIALYRGPATGESQGLRLADGRLLQADALLAATGGRAPAWLRSSGLTLDEAGRVLVDAGHRSLSHAGVFAAGDVCARQDVVLAHSGVHAVRAGPVLAANLLASLDGRPLRPYRPRRRTLYLLATGPRHAIASWGKWCVGGRWVWYCKRWIDNRFIRRHSPAGWAR